MMIHEPLGGDGKTFGMHLVVLGLLDLAQLVLMLTPLDDRTTFGGKRHEATD